MRAKGLKICEFTRLAVDASAVSRPVLAGLFHTVYLFARNVRGYDFVVIEVNPRHVGYYRRSLGFEILGEERHNLRVNAPAVLMGMSFRKIGENMHRYAGKGTRPARQAQARRAWASPRRPCSAASTSMGSRRRRRPGFSFGCEGSTGRVPAAPSPTRGIELRHRSDGPSSDRDLRRERQRPWLSRYAWQSNP